jgi:Lrp/AsnC family transcriptional regulator for asnA, asnC and gidA
MDDIDKKILTLLQDNDRISFAKIAELLGMAASSIHYRVKKMEKEGIIKKYSAIIDSAKVGYNTTAWLGLSVDPLRMREIAKEIAKYDEVQLVATSTGDHDLVIQVIEKSDRDLWNFVNEKVKTIPGIKSQMDVSSFIDVFKNSFEIKFNIQISKKPVLGKSASVGDFDE